MSDEFQKSYDAVAEDYAAHFRDEMDKKPFDRKMLDWLAEKVGTRGVVCDMGCGPGQIPEPPRLHLRAKAVNFLATNDTNDTKNRFKYFVFFRVCSWLN